MIVFLKWKEVIEIRAKIRTATRHARNMVSAEWEAEEEEFGLEFRLAFRSEVEIVLVKDGCGS